MATYTTSVDIANRALQLLGCTSIVTLGDDSKNAVAANFLYDKARVLELRRNVWNFAIEYTALSTVHDQVEYQNGQKRNRFALPSDYARIADQNPRTAGTAIQGTMGGVKYTDYSVEGGYIVTSQSGLQLRYVGDITSVTLMDPIFCEALASFMAAGMCMQLTQNPQKFQLAVSWYNDMIGLAARINLIEAASDEPLEEAIKTARINDALVNALAAQPKPQARR